MCLDIIYKGNQKKEALAKLPKSGYYWKVVVLSDGKYYPPIFSEYGNYKSGWNSTQPKSNYTGYLLAYHLFRNKKEADKMKRWVSVHGKEKKKIVTRCRVKRKDIINVGTQGKDLCIVTKRFWIPKPPKKKKKIA